MPTLRVVLYNVPAATADTLAYCLTILWVQLTWLAVLATAFLSRYQYVTYYAASPGPAIPFAITNPETFSTFGKFVAAIALCGPTLGFLLYTGGRVDQQMRWFRVMKGLLMLQPAVLVLLASLMAVEYKFNPWVEKGRRVWEVLQA